jgi:hypothetical protein
MSQHQPHLKKTWKYKTKNSTIGNMEGVLVAYWQVKHGSISDEYTPGEISTENLFYKWVDRVSKEYSDGLVPIQWGVMHEDYTQAERMPFQFDSLNNSPSTTDFLSSYTHPVNSITGEPLNWLELPVVCLKCEFIQAVTGWEPSILQPFVYLPSLTKTYQI